MCINNAEGTQASKTGSELRGNNFRVEKKEGDGMLTELTSWPKRLETVRGNLPGLADKRRRKNKETRAGG